MIFIFENEFKRKPYLMAGSFSSIFTNALIEAGIKSYREFSKKLFIDGNINITPKRIGEYCSGKGTPPVDKARIMLDVLDYEISDTELIDAIQKNKEFVLSRKDESESNEIRISIRIKTGRLVGHYSSANARQILEKRIKDLFGSENDYTSYIQALIRADLEQYILSEEYIREIEEEIKKEEKA